MGLNNLQTGGTGGISPGGLRNLTEISAIPASAILNLDAQSAFASATDGDSVSTWPDELSGGYDATGGGPVVAKNSINGYVSVQFDGTDDVLNNTSLSASQPNTVFCVWEYTGDGSDNPRIYDSDASGGSGAGDHAHRLNFFGDTTIESDGSEIVGNATPQDTPKLTVGVFDGGNSILREEGTQTASGSIGTLGLDGYRVGTGQDGTRYFPGYIGEIMVVGEKMSTSEIQDQEARIADKWDITI